MNRHFLGYLLLGLSILVYLLSGLAFVQMIFSLTIKSTVTAVESAFGSLVISILLMIIATKAFKGGKKRIINSE
jgi:uncharacterized membrane protein